MSRAAPLAAAIILLMPNAGRTQDLPESSPQALLHHAQGVDAYVKGDNAAAIRHFLAAVESDPTSHVSLLMAGIAAGNAGQGARADSFYARVVPHKNKLSLYYQYRLESQMAGRAGDGPGVVAANRKAAELGPGTKAWYNLALALAPRVRTAEAVDALRKLDPDREPMKGWYSYYSVYADAAHAHGAHEDELAVARRSRVAFPGDIRAAFREAQALAALGRLAEAEKIMSEIQTLPASGLTTPGQVLTTLALELSAHGNPSAGRRWLETALKWFDTLPADSMKTVDNRFDRAYTLYLLGRFREAGPVFDALAVEQPNNSAWKAWQGRIAALTGDKARATDIAKKLESGEYRMAPSNSALWRGLIASGLGDRQAAIALLQQADVRPAWMHRDPHFQKEIGKDPTWIAYMKRTP